VEGVAVAHRVVDRRIAAALAAHGTDRRNHHHHHLAAAGTGQEQGIRPEVGSFAVLARTDQAGHPGEVVGCADIRRVEDRSSDGAAGGRAGIDRAVDRNYVVEEGTIAGRGMMVADSAGENDTAALNREEEGHCSNPGVGMSVLDLRSRRLTLSWSSRSSVPVKESLVSIIILGRSYGE
jgi:hypothetical protein